jgi:glutamate-1-semialdehyde 2,1-aminomutase
MSKQIILPNITNFTKSDEHRSRIHSLIPGGAHTYSKGDDQFPIKSPAAITHGKGVYCWDMDGNKYLDTLMGLTSVSLGHAYEPVIERVKEELSRGSNFSRPGLIEREMAERFLALVPQHDMIKYAKNGSVVTTAAIKLARAATGRQVVARTAEHPFYSYDDWFIGSTDCDFGVPREVKDMTVTFKHNDLDDLERMFNEHPGQIACIIGEPEKWKVIEPDFYQKAIAIAHKHGALWIMDEMITGFKTDYPGSIKRLNAEPDMATWGKGIANGFSFCALTGKKEVMELGGINKEGDKKLFLASTTHGGETHAIAAGLATMDVFENEPVIAHNHRIGDYFIAGVNSILDRRGLQDYFDLTGFNWSVGLIVKNRDKQPDLFYRTLFMQEMIQRGVLYQGILSPCYSHATEDIDFMLAAFDASCDVFEKALQDGYEKHLVGPEIKPVFRKFN